MESQVYTLSHMRDEGVDTQVDSTQLDMGYLPNLTITLQSVVLPPRIAANTLALDR